MNKTNDVVKLWLNGSSPNYLTRFYKDIREYYLCKIYIYWFILMF